MRAFCLLAALVLSTAVGLAGASPEGRRLAKQAQKAERAGDVVRAYLLYSQALTEDPHNLDYWVRSQALRARATLSSTSRLPATPVNSAEVVAAPSQARDSGQFQGRLAPQPPVQLKVPPGRRDIDLRGDATRLFTAVASRCQLAVIFDRDYQSVPPLTFRLHDVTCQEALRGLEAATASFVVPMAEHRILVVKDTPQKRTDFEPVVTVEVPIPAAATTQEMQDITRGVQQALALTRVGVDTQHSAIVIRDRLCRVRPAQELIEQLLRGRAVVSIEMDFLEQARTSTTSYGASLPTLFPLVAFGSVLNSVPSIPAGFSSFATFGGGASFLGVGISRAQVFAHFSRSLGRTLFHTEIRSVDGQPASIHVGDRYPVATSRFLSSNPTDQLSVPPVITFLDLGLLIQITPRVNGAEEVTLTLDSEFKALTGQVVDELPVVSNRKLQSDVRLRSGEWAVVAGLMNAFQARTISGLAGLSRVPFVGPLLRNNIRDETDDQVLVILKPTLLSLPPSEQPVAQVRLGSENRPPVPFF